MIVHYHRSNFFSPSRCTLQNWGAAPYDYTSDCNPETKKTGIRCHSFIVALLLRLFGKIQEEKTCDGKIVYLNRRSFTKWKEWRESQLNTVEKIEIVRQKLALPEPVLQVEEPLIEELPPEKPVAPAEKCKEMLIEELPPEKPATPAEKCKEMLSECTTSDLYKLWGGLLDCVPSEQITGFESNNAHSFLLKFKRPQTLWLDSRSEDGSRSEPKGGTIVLLAHNQMAEIEFSLHPNTKEITFLGGMQFYCDTARIGVKTLNVVSIKDDRKKAFAIRAGLKVLFKFQSQEKLQPKAQCIKTWNHARLLDRHVDPGSYLKAMARAPLKSF